MKSLSIAVLVGVVATALGLAVGPHPPQLAHRGGSALTDRVLDIVRDERAGYRGLSVAVVDRAGTGTGTSTTTALLGDASGGPAFETGSIGKVFTGLLLADLIADGTVRADDRLRTLLPDVRFDDPRVGDVTLAELASHRSGLPRLGSGPRGALTAVRSNLSGGNPYGETADDVLRQAAATSVGDGRGEVHYSNFGMALLGQALAVRTGTPYPDLITARILRPLGLNDTTIDAPANDDWAQGSTASGRPVDAWSGPGYAPAGVGVRSTAADLAKLVAAMLAGTAPGADSATPRWADGDQRIGYAWFTDEHGITWHNGATGGFSTYLGFDRQAGTGVVVLGDTGRAVEWIGLRLLDAPAEPSGVAAVPWLFAITLLLVVYCALTLPLLARGRAPDRLRVVGGVFTTVAVALLAHRLGDWVTVPPVVWALGVGVAAGGAALLVVRWRDLPVRAAGRAWVRWLGLAVSVAFSVVIGVAVA